MIGIFPLISSLSSRVLKVLSEKDTQALVEKCPAMAGLLRAYLAQMNEHDFHALNEDDAGLGLIRAGQATFGV